MTDPQVQAITAIVVGNVASIFAGVFWLVRTVTKVETKVDILARDVDGIAEFVGTPRARAQKEKSNEQ